ncbi:carboxymuconolactone decarboxylase family protein [Mycobacterium sp. NPDC003449]
MRHPLRLAPLPSGQWDDDIRSSLTSLIPAERANPEGAGNVLSTLVRHPALTRAYLPFNAYLLRDSQLSPRVREVALLRTVLRCGCDYLWDHHLPIAGRAGLTGADIDGVRRGHCTEVLDDSVVRAVDDLVAFNTVTQSTWDRLARDFDDAQRMDLVFTIGGYQLLALAVNTFGVQAE